MTAADTQVNWLIQEGGPVVRWLALTNLVDQPSQEHVRRAKRNLLKEPHVRLWLDRLENVKGFHNSGNDCFENVAGKLGEFGLHAGMDPLDANMARFVEWVSNPTRKREQGMMATLNRLLACAGLLRLGYTSIDAVRDFALSRLDQVHHVASWRRYDVFLPEDPLDMPKAYRGRYRVVAPEFTPGGVSHLPYIHDLYMLAYMPDAWRTDEVCRKMRAVVQYVLADAYQRLPAGYGYLRDDSDVKPRYYVLGWNVDLPGYRAPLAGHARAYFIQRLELMSRFPEARKHPWWARAMKLLSDCRTPTGRYLLPRSWLQEKPAGYWVTGSHMGLEKSRRSGQTFETESTLRAMRLLNTER
jgi:hypothetical protein